MKYKVEQDGQFLGHWQTKTPADAVVKAIEEYGSYYDIDTNDFFDVYRGSKHAKIYVGEE